MVEALLRDPLGVGAHGAKIASSDCGQDKAEKVGQSLPRERFSRQFVMRDVPAMKGGVRLDDKLTPQVSATAGVFFSF